MSWLLNYCLKLTRKSYILKLNHNFQYKEGIKHYKLPTTSDGNFKLINIRTYKCTKCGSEIVIDSYIYLNKVKFDNVYGKYVHLDYLESCEKLTMQKVLQ